MGSEMCIRDRVKVVEVGAGSKDYGNLVQVVMGTEIASRSML